MTSRKTAGDPTFVDSVPGWRLGMARAALFWERLWPAAWPAVAVFGLFTALAWLDVFSAFHAWIHALLLIGFAAAFLYALWGVRFALPTEADSIRRIEVLSGVAHRPLATLRDHLATGDDDVMAKALWDLHRRRMKDQLGRGRIGLPMPGMAKMDPWALRAALGLLLVVGGVVAGPEEWGSRLWRASVPQLKAAEGGAGQVLGFEVWITPLAYTGLPTLLPTHEQRGAEPLPVAVGSAILVQVIGGRDVPTLTVGDEAPIAFETIDESSFRLNGTLSTGPKIVVTQGKKTLAEWPIRIVPDQVPTIAYTAPPQQNQRMSIRLEYDAADDYGLAAIRAFVRKAPRADGTGVTMTEQQEMVELQLPLPGQRPKAAHATSYHDLTPHPWAGLPVLLQLRATDALGQVGTSDDFAMTLPERIFTNPVAKAIIDQRKVLSVDPGQRRQVSDALRNIGAMPKHYFEDVVTFLSLRTAGLRLLRDSSEAGTKAVQSLLWDTALRIEDGKVSVAERDVKNLQQKLMEALANGASNEEVKRLMQELRQAMDNMFREMMQEAMRNADQQPQKGDQPTDPNASQTTSEDNDLRKMLEQAQKLAEAGMREEARKMLQRMQDMMENMRRQAQNNEKQAGDPEKARQAQQMAKEVQDLAKRQQQLLDQNFRQQQQQGQRGQQQQQQQKPGQPGGDQPPQEMQPGVSERIEGRGTSQGQQGATPGRQEGEGGGQGTAAYQQQEQLRRDLGDVMRKLGENMNNIPENLANAEQSMREAANALSRGQINQAMRPQTEAVEKLMKGLREMQQQNMQAQGEGEGDPMDEEMRDRQAGDSRDPAGRPLNGLGGIDARDVRIPEEAELQRSREIYDELLRRAGERERPPIERDYLDRLLKRF